MDKLKKCRICLVDNVQMYVVADKNLQEIYEKLTDVPFVTADNRPMLACFVCYSMLKQCYQLQRKCLEAEELFTQMLNGDYKRKPLINQGLLECRRGLNKTPTMQISIDDECQPERIAIKEELPAVFEGLDDIIEPKEEHQSDGLEDDVPLMEIKTEVEEEQEAPAVYEGLDNIIEPKEEHQIELELENLDNSCLDVADIKPYHSESDLEDDVPLMEIKIEMEEEQEVSKKKQRVTRATVAKKLKLDTRRTKLEDAETAEGMKKVKSDSKVIRRKRTSKPDTYLKETYNLDPLSLLPKGDLTKHIRKRTGEKPYKCRMCPRRFSVKCSLLRHIRMHKGDTPYKCDFCQRCFSDQCVLVNHIRIHTGEKPFKCDICQSSFRQKGHLKEHIRVHLGAKPFMCDVCQRNFSHKSHLIEHTRLHTGEKPYKCDVCQISFTYKRNLNQHIRIHTNEKPYKCDVCQRSFNEEGQLLQHSSVHTGERPFKCDVCQHSFSSNSDVIKHNRIHTGEKPFKCDKCERSFRQPCHLKRHNLIHTC